MSQLLREFLSAWIEWVDAGAATLLGAAVVEVEEATA